MEAFHGHMHQFFFAFGEYDGISIVEFPNNESCAACAVTLIGAGGPATLRTTVLLTANEGQAAMLRAWCSIVNRTLPNSIMLVRSEPENLAAWATACASIEARWASGRLANRSSAWARREVS